MVNSKTLLGFFQMAIKCQQPPPLAEDNKGEEGGSHHLCVCLDSYTVGVQPKECCNQF